MLNVGVVTLSIKRFHSISLEAPNVLVSIQACKLLQAGNPRLRRGEDQDGEYYILLRTGALCTARIGTELLDKWNYILLQGRSEILRHSLEFDV